MKNEQSDNQREKDIQTVCSAILSIGIDSTGDYGPGGQCPFCCAPCRWNDDISEVSHKLDCAYLVAKDLSTGF